MKHMGYDIQTISNSFIFFIRSSSISGYDDL